MIVTTDHGHQQSKGFGHGFQSPNETSSFVIFDLEGDDSNDGKQNLGYTTADITPTIVDLFGVSAAVGLRRRAVDRPRTIQHRRHRIDSGCRRSTTQSTCTATRTSAPIWPWVLGRSSPPSRTSWTGSSPTSPRSCRAIVEKDIFLISALAGVTKALVQITGDLGVAVTQAIARVVARLTGAGTIPPTDPRCPRRRPARRRPRSCCCCRQPPWPDHRATSASHSRHIRHSVRTLAECACPTA